MHKVYPAGEAGWTKAGNRDTDEEPFVIHIRVPCKRSDEGFTVFERRFNQECRRARIEYIKGLKAEGWTSRSPFIQSVWIDYLARWQAGGHPASAIYSKASTSAGREMFSRRTKQAADYLELTRRKGREFHKPVGI